MLPENTQIKDIDTKEGGGAPAPGLRDTRKAPPMSVDLLNQALRFAIEKAALTFEQEHLLRRALSQEYTRLLLSRGEP